MPKILQFIFLWYTIQFRMYFLDIDRMIPMIWSMLYFPTWLILLKYKVFED